VAEEGLDLDFEALQEVEEVPASVMAGDSVTVDSGPREEIEEFLAEADFYFQQGLLDEAEFLYSKLSKLDPQNEEIIDRLRRFEEQKKTAPLLSDDGISALESDLDRILSDEAKPDRGLKITVSGDEGDGQPGEFSEFLSDLREELDEDVPLPEPVASSSARRISRPTTISGLRTRKWVSCRRRSGSSSSRKRARSESWIRSA
jgi:hypothetical protein